MTDNTITRNDLYHLYVANQEKQRMLKNDVYRVRAEVMKANETGETIYILPPIIYNDDYLQTFINEIKAIFIDSTITIKQTVTKEPPLLKKTTIMIDWSLEETSAGTKTIF